MLVRITLSFFEDAQHQRRLWVGGCFTKQSPKRSNCNPDATGVSFGVERELRPTAEGEDETFPVDRLDELVEHRGAGVDTGVHGLSQVRADITHLLLLWADVSHVDDVGVASDSQPLVREILLGEEGRLDQQVEMRVPKGILADLDFKDRHATLHFLTPPQSSAEGAERYVQPL